MLSGLCFLEWRVTVIARRPSSPPNHVHPSEPSSFCSSHPSFIFSFHLMSHPLPSAPLFSSFLTLSLHFVSLIPSLSIIVYLHSVHFLPSLMALRWGVFLVRHCNEDWNTISWMATVSFLHHPGLQQSDRCCCCCCCFPVCSYWCVSSSLSRYC